MTKTMPVLMILNIQVVKQISHILRNNQVNLLKILHMLKKEINIISSIFLEGKVYTLKQNKLNSSELAKQIELLDPRNLDIEVKGELKFYKI